MAMPCWMTLSKVVRQSMDSWKRNSGTRARMKVETRKCSGWWPGSWLAKVLQWL